jgi:hypothetical protein
LQIGWFIFGAIQALSYLDQPAQRLANIAVSYIRHSIPNTYNASLSPEDVGYVWVIAIIFDWLQDRFA